MLYFWVGFVVGLVCGIIIQCVRVKYAGTIRIDRSDPKKDLYSMEFTIPLEDLPGKKKVMLHVSAE